jgi:hypothetical protein
MKSAKTELQMHLPFLMVTGLVLMMMPTISGVRAAKPEVRPSSSLSGASNQGLLQALSGVCTDVSFISPADSPFSVGRDPEAIVAGDFNADGDRHPAADPHLSGESDRGDDGFGRQYSRGQLPGTDGHG